MRSRDTVKMQGFELAATLVPPSDFQKLFGGPRRAPLGPSGKENWLRNPWVTPSPPAEQIDCIFARDYEQKCLRGL